MGAYYLIHARLLRMPASEEAREAARHLKRTIEEIGRREGAVAEIVEANGELRVQFDLPLVYVGAGEVDAIDHAIERLAKFVPGGVAIPYVYDGEAGVDYHGATPQDARTAEVCHRARLAAEELSAAGAPFAPAGIEPALRALINLGGTERSLVFGVYDDTGDTGVFVVDGDPAQARTVMQGYLKALDEAEKPERVVQSGMPDSPNFEILLVLGAEDLLNWMALLDPGVKARKIAGAAA